MRVIRRFVLSLSPAVFTAMLSVYLFGSLAMLVGCSSGGGSTSTLPPAATAPSITTQPAAQSLFVGDTATFSVVASGTAPLTYQWARSGASISGATNASYTTAALTAADDGATFTVTVSNSAGSVTSSSAKLSVAAHAPAITTQPAAQSVFVGDTAAFSVVATGTAPLTYDWRKNGTSLGAANSASYTTPALAATDDGALYTVVITNAGGSVTSSSAKLSVAVRAPAITTGPAALTVPAGQAATFSVVATGTAPLTYQWLRGGTPIAGASTASYSLGNTQLTDSGSLFSVTVSNSAGTVTSSTAALTVTAAPVAITTQPLGVTQFVGETATFSVVVTGTSPTYQWRKNGGNIAGATSATYTTPALAATDDQTTYDVVVSNSANSLASTVATLRVGPFATVYTTQQGKTLNLFAWPGTKNAMLTKTSALDPVQMRKLLAAADGTWNYYAGATGKLPSIFFNYNGLATIADTGVGGVDLCGDGCTYIGATGMEISDNSWGWLYGGLPSNIYDQVIFYEFGRSFWTFGNQLEYKSPDVSSCMVTGFAVLMRYRSLQAQGLTGTFGGSTASYTTTYNNTLGLIDNYAANTSLTWSNTFRSDSYNGTGGLGCSDLFASLTIRLAQNYGGEAFIQGLYKAAALRPNTVTTQDAVDNFVLSASAAANHNLTTIFTDQWRWPVSPAASAEAMTKWGKP